MDIEAFGIRAANALNWKTSSYHNTKHFYLIPEKYGKHLIDVEKQGGKLLNAYPGEMGFHKNYQWAMLGVKEANKPLLFCELIKIKPFERQFIDPDKDDYTSEWEWYMTEWLFSFEPAELTEAWVNVLEKNKLLGE